MEFLSISLPLPSGRNSISEISLCISMHNRKIIADQSFSIREMEDENHVIQKYLTP